MALPLILIYESNRAHLQQKCMLKAFLFVTSKAMPEDQAKEVMTE